MPASPLVVVTNSLSSARVRAPLYVSILEPALGEGVRGERGKERLGGGRVSGVRKGYLK